MLSLVLPVGAAAPGDLWGELSAKREKLASFHQEFDVSQTLQTAHGSQSSKWQIMLDASGRQWREKSIMGSGNRIRVFDGKDLLSMDEGENEFMRTKRHAKDDDPVPTAYYSKNADWSKSSELERRPCGIPGVDHVCVLFNMPLKPSTEVSAGSSITKNLGGTQRMIVDIETGLVQSLRIVETIESERSSYRRDIKYGLRRVGYGTPADASLFQLPKDLQEVKELSRWDAAKIKKQFAGNPAPELALTDIQGKPVSVAAAKGKTVLLDFWTTWCAPCREDAPALDKLYGKYGERDLMIVGISVNEERAVVEQFLKEHPHAFPIALTSENEMPRAYQIGVFPTYVVINPDGTLASAVQGEKGFGELRKLLKKAGLDVN